ncbi:MAG: hypothetical protein HC803_10400 [Saprospiraceae bacterium]|nr:hypothetical protein [Saprospiraceae bacterium]
MRNVKLLTTFLVGIVCSSSILYLPQQTVNDNVQLVAGFEHSLILHQNTVWTWGKYQDFNNESTYLSTPTITTNLDGVIAISEGCAANHTLAIKSDSTVWAWGNNEFGQVTGPESKNEAFPIKINKLKNIVQVAAGKSHSIALMSDGTVWTWGGNKYGQLGLGNEIDQNIVRKVPNLKGIIAIAAGANHTLALKDDGTVWTWGRNNVGQLGIGTTEMAIRPEKVLMFESVTAIAAGGYHNLVLTADGKVFAWGWNDYGQIGNGTDLNWKIPVEIEVEKVKMIRAGMLHSTILKNDGTVWAWGDNTFGQAADYKKDRIWQPRKINTLKNIQTISAGDLHNVALDKSGQVWTWGINKNERTNNSNLGENIPFVAFNINDLEARVYVTRYEDEYLKGEIKSPSIQIYGLEESREKGPFEIPISDNYLIDTMYHTIKIGEVLLEACPTEQALKKLTIHLTCNQDSLVQLTWNLNANDDDYYENFFLEKSYDGMKWTEVNEYLTIDKQAFETKFSILDKTISKKKNTFYRLKQLNCDEYYVYSNIIRTECFSSEMDGHFKSKFTVSI